jgi:hypothetical protein
MPAETRKSQDMRRHGILAQQQDAERVSVGVQQQQRRPLMQNAMRQDMSAGNPPPIPMGGADRGGSMMNDGMMRRNSAPVMQNRTMEDDFDPTKPNGWF